MLILTSEEFDKEKRKSIKQQNSQFGNVSHRANHNVDHQKLYDDSCSICMENFENKNKVLITSCNHAFHEKCLDDWIKSRIDKIYD